MTPAARSLHLFGLYLCLLAPGLVLAPGPLLAPFAIAASKSPVACQRSCSEGESTVPGAMAFTRMPLVV